MAIRQLKIHNIATTPFNLISIGKGNYVLARCALFYPQGIATYLPTTFLLMHHSLEVLIKALLVHENISYSYNADGHKLVNLLKLGAKNSTNLKFFETQILKNSELRHLINALQNSYNMNRYSFPGYEIDIAVLRKNLDELVYMLIENFCLIYEQKVKLPRHMRQIDVPSDLCDAFEFQQQQLFFVCEIPNELKERKV